MVSIVRAVDGQPYDADDYNLLASTVETHDAAINAQVAFVNAGDLGKAVQMGTGSGTIPSGSNSVNVVITFPHAFSAAPTVVLPAYDSSLGGLAGNFGVRVSARSATQATVVAYRTDGTNAPANQAVTFGWLAVGAP